MSYREALEAARQNLNGGIDLHAIVAQIQYSINEIAEMEQRANDGCAWSCLVLAIYHYEHRNQYIGWVVKGSDLGCPVSKYYLAQEYEGAPEYHPECQEPARKLYLESARAGNRDSMEALGCMFEREDDYVKAAEWYARAVPESIVARKQLRYLRQYHPNDIVPWGHWTATKVHWRLLTYEQRQEIIQWLMVARRIGVLRDLAVLICCFIVTS
jgi:TPR repeat protein